MRRVAMVWALLVPALGGASPPEPIDVALSSEAQPGEGVKAGEAVMVTVTIQNKNGRTPHTVSVSFKRAPKTDFDRIVAPPQWRCQNAKDGGELAGDGWRCDSQLLLPNEAAVVMVRLRVGLQTPPDTEVGPTITVTSDETAGCTVQTVKPPIKVAGPKLLTWIRDNVQVRRTFDGSAKDENKPANITWNSRDTATGKAFWDLNLAVKVKEWHLGSLLYVFPVFEWHRQTTTVSPTNKASGKIGVEWYPVSWRNPHCKELSGRAAPAGSPGESQGADPCERAAVPFLTGNGEWARDWGNKTWSTSATTLLSMTSRRDWWPGRKTRLLNNTQAVRYYLYVGAEYGDKLPTVNGGSLYTGLARVSAEWNWLSFVDPQHQFTQVLLEYNVRRRVSGNTAVNRRLDFGAAEANVFLDRKGNVAIGYRYQRGYDRLKDFAYTDQSSVGLKFKF